MRFCLFLWRTARTEGHPPLVSFLMTLDLYRQCREAQAAIDLIAIRCVVDLLEQT